MINNYFSSTAECESVECENEIWVWQTLHNQRRSRERKVHDVSTIFGLKAPLSAVSARKSSCLIPKQLIILHMTRLPLNIIFLSTIHLASSLKKFSTICTRRTQSSHLRITFFFTIITSFRPLRDVRMLSDIRKRGKTCRPVRSTKQLRDVAEWVVWKWAMMQLGLNLSTKTIKISRFDGCAVLTWACCPMASNGRTRCRSRARRRCRGPAGIPAACICTPARCTRTSTSRDVTSTENDGPVSTTRTRWRMRVCCCCCRSSTACWTRRRSASPDGSGRSSTDVRMCGAAPWSESWATRPACERARMWMRRSSRGLWRTSSKRALSSPTVRKKVLKLFYFKALSVKIYSGNASQAVHQARNIFRLRLLDELDGGWKVDAQVLRPVVGDGYLKVFDLAGVLEDVGKRRHVQDVANVVLLDLDDVLAVRGVAQKQPGKNLDGLAAVRLQWIVGSAFSVGRLRWAAARGIRKRRWDPKRSVSERSEKKRLNCMFHHVTPVVNHVQRSTFIYKSHERHPAHQQTVAACFMSHAECNRFIS